MQNNTIAFNAMLGGAFCLTPKEFNNLNYAPAMAALLNVGENFQQINDFLNDFPVSFYRLKGKPAYLYACVERRGNCARYARVVFNGDYFECRSVVVAQITEAHKVARANNRTEAIALFAGVDGDYLPRPRILERGA